MRGMARVTLDDGRLVGERVRIARSPQARLRGLIGHRTLDAGQGLLLRPCNGIHTWGMRFPIDVLFLDGSGRVLRVKPGLPPRQVVPWVRGSKQVLELPDGAAAGIPEGARLHIEEVEG